MRGNYSARSVNLDSRNITTISTGRRRSCLGLSLPDVFNTLQIELGSLYVNDFNAVRPDLPRDHAGRERSTRRSDQRLGLYVRNTDGGMVPLEHTGKLAADGRARRTCRTTTIYGSALINGVAAPGYSSGQAIAAMQRAAAKVLPADFGYEWTGITYQQLKAGCGRGNRIRPRDRSLCFLFLAAQYESWSMPFMVILAVPLALFGAVGSAVGARHAIRRVFADRVRHADRPGGQERDLDRRIRQAKREHGSEIVAAAMEAGGCGCARS